MTPARCWRAPMPRRRAAISALRSPNCLDLPDGARSAAEPWIKKAQAREAAIAASRRVAADALAALGRPVTQ